MASRTPPEATPCAQGRGGPISTCRVLEQRHWDLIGLGLVAFAAFFACVFYLDWAGGEVGEALADAILFLFGGVGYAAPGAAVRRRRADRGPPDAPGAPSAQDRRGLPAAALMLGLAAGSLGLGPGDTPRDGFLDPRYLEHHGGLVGESLFWASAKLFSTAGSHILFVFLLLAGVLLLTGASIAGILTATREAAATTTERVRRTGRADRARCPYAAAAADRARRSPRTASRWCARRTWRCRRTTTRRVRRVRAGGRAGRRGRARAEPRPSSRTPEPEPADEPEPAERRGRRAHARWATGARRSPSPTTSTTGCRSSRFLKRSNGAQKVDTKGIERVGAQLVEALSHFNVEARLIGTVGGPARDPLRAAPRARHQDVEGRAAEGRPRLRARRRAGAHPRADPRQAGRGRRGAEPRAHAWCTSATSSRTRRRAGRRCRSGSARTSPARRSAPTSPSSRTS